MIIFLYGKDTYRMREKMKEIVEHYKKVHKSGLNLKYPEKFEDLKDELKQTSIFKEKKLIIINNLFSNSEFKEKFSENIKTDADDIILICQEGDINKNDSMFKFLKKNAKYQGFNLLQGAKLKNWIKKEFEKYSARIDSEALAKLIEYIGNDLWQMSNEIRKLASYKKPARIATRSVAGGEISLAHVELLVRSKIETDIFKTIDAIAEKNKKQALDLVHKHLEKGNSPLYLLSMINYQFRNLLMVKSSDMSKITIHPFVLRKNYYQSQRFSLEELKKIYQKIFQIDIDIKTGRIEPWMALDLLIAEL